MKYLVLLLLLSCNKIRYYVTFDGVPTEVYTCIMYDTYVFYKTLDRKTMRRSCIKSKCSCEKHIEHSGSR